MVFVNTARVTDRELMSLGVPQEFLATVRTIDAEAQLDAIQAKLPMEDASFKSIEHIYPQTPKDPSWTSRFVFDGRQERTRQMWMNSLGNLLLLSCEVNASLSNRRFSDKKKYATGSYSENKVAQNHVVWSPSAVIRRGVTLLEFVEERWGFSFADWNIRYEDCLRTDKGRVRIKLLQLFVPLGSLELNDYGYCANE
ncbi:GmrSD restriction endonuclease domain-containing protein [Paraburkholderia sp. RL17-347-BIC-D]|uniref:GmrSD restriction endonuclease domain-containing protein n=1 Tax=Paraburkholderia sp. RL17-347-BIC-D TaxID=3031632 RepID=UPI0038B775E7